MSTEDLIYTSTFKLHNVDIISQRIDIAQDSWIARNSAFAQQIPTYIGQLLSTNISDPDFGLLRFFRELFASEVVIATRHTAQEAENNPFEIHDSSRIAMAISILSDYWFVAGIETFTNNRVTNHDGLSPYTTMFNGKKDGKVVIDRSEEASLKIIYEFIHQALCISTYDERKARLLYLYLGCIVKSSPKSFTVLKQGFASPFSGETGAIIYGAIFFEHVFTTDSWNEDLEKGVKIWNKHFSTTPVTWEDVKVLQKYRHILVHDKANRALDYMKDWQKKYKVSDTELIFKLEEILLHNVKLIIRVIILNYKKYEAYRLTLSK